MKSYILYFFLICFMSCHRTEKPVNLIFDTDMAQTTMMLEHWLYYMH